MSEGQYQSYYDPEEPEEVTILKLQSKIDELKRQLEDMGNANLELEDSYHKEVATRVEFEQENAELKKYLTHDVMNVPQMFADILDYKEQIAALKSDLEMKEANLQLFSNQIDDLKAEADALRKKYLIKTDVLEALARRDELLREWQAFLIALDCNCHSNLGLADPIESHKPYCQRRQAINLVTKYAELTKEVKG